VAAGGAPPPPHRSALSLISLFSLFLCESQAGLGFVHFRNAIDSTSLFLSPKNFMGLFCYIWINFGPVWHMKRTVKAQPILVFPKN
jgi:hypothetical protein